jgi:antitoxin component of MazEF toxin-antitoxin module
MHADCRTLVAHNESEHSLSVNLTHKASKELGFNGGEDVVVRLHDDGRIVIEPCQEKGGTA